MQCVYRLWDDDMYHVYCLYVDDGYWRGGRFLFEITIPSNYNIMVSIATMMYIVNNYHITYHDCSCS